MTDPIDQANKQLVLDFWAALDQPSTAARASATSFLAVDARWCGHEPVGTIQGAEAFLHDAWEPLRGSFPDLERDTFLFFAGASNGRVDGDISKDGHRWVTGTGVFRATFSADYLGIPATGQPVAVRWGEFCRVVEGRIDEVYFLVDLIDLIDQAGMTVLPPSRGEAGRYPPPGAGDGVILDDRDGAVSAYSVDHLRRFLFDGLNTYDQEALESMGMADWFHPDVQWFGPGGIGACNGLHEFEDLHQAPWLVAFPDRQVQDLTALFAEGSYSAAPGWAGVEATHTGEYLGVAATGRPIVFNGLDWWKRDGEQYIENWVFVDMVHLFGQFGVDLLGRINESS